MNVISRYTPALILFLIICSIIYMADNGVNNIVFRWLLFVPFGDKLGHVFLYGFLCALLQIALQFKTRVLFYFKIQLAAIWVLSFAVVEELSQLLVVNRTFDGWDIAADVLGVSLSSLLLKPKNKE